MPTQILAPPVTERIFTLAEFETFAEFADGKYELENGYLIEMPQNLAPHAYIVRNLIRHLNRLLDALDFEVYSVFPENARLRPDGEISSYYPDVVVCTMPLSSDKLATIEEPLIAIEVLSPSTWRRDKGVKQEAYLAYTSLENYMMVSQTERKVEVWNRDDRNEWLLHTYMNPTDDISLLGGKIRLKLVDIYKNVL